MLAHVEAVGKVILALNSIDVDGENPIGGVSPEPHSQRETHTLHLI